MVASHVNLTAGMYNRPRELMWFADGLKEGSHTIELTNQGFTGGGDFSIDYAVV